MVTSTHSAFAGFVQVPDAVKSCVSTVSAWEIFTPPAVEPSPMYTFFVSVT